MHRGQNIRGPLHTPCQDALPLPFLSTRRSPHETDPHDTLRFVNPIPHNTLSPSTHHFSPHAVLVNTLCPSTHRFSPHALVVNTPSPSRHHTSRQALVVNTPFPSTHNFSRNVFNTPIPSTRYSSRHNNPSDKPPLLTRRQAGTVARYLQILLHE